MEFMFPQQNFYEEQRRSSLLTDVAVMASCLLSAFLIARLSPPAEG